MILFCLSFLDTAFHFRDLSYNDISNIDPDALKHLKSLTEIKLGNNPYVCEASICSFRIWLIG